MRTTRQWRNRTLDRWTSPGGPSKGIVFVAGADLDDDAMQGWVQRGLAFTGSLPPK